MASQKPSPFFPFLRLARELRDKVFRHLTDPEQECFNAHIMAVNKQLSEEAGEKFDKNQIICVEIYLPGVANWIDIFRVPLLVFNETSQLHSRIAAFAVSGRRRLHFVLGPPTNAPPPFVALMLARDLPSLCLALQWYVYGQSVFLGDARFWTWDNDEKGGAIITSTPAFWGRLACTINGSANKMKRLTVQEEDRLLAPLKSLIEPGLCVTISGSARSIANPSPLPMTMGPRVASLEAMTWFMLETTRGAHGIMEKRFRAGNLAALFCLYNSVTYAWTEGILWNMPGNFKDYGNLDFDKVILPLACAGTILLDCTAMVLLLLIQELRMDEARDISYWATANILNKITAMPGIETTDLLDFDSLLDIAHLELQRCFLLGVLLGDIENEQIKDVMGGLRAVYEAKPDREHMAVELLYLEEIAQDEEFHAAWKDGKLDKQEMLKRLQLVAHDDIPRTEAAYTQSKPGHLVGFMEV